VIPVRCPKESPTDENKQETIGAITAPTCTSSDHKIKEYDLCRKPFQTEHLTYHLEKYTMKYSSINHYLDQSDKIFSSNQSLPFINSTGRYHTPTLALSQALISIPSLECAVQSVNLNLSKCHSTMHPHAKTLFSLLSLFMQSHPLLLLVLHLETVTCSDSIIWIQYNQLVIIIR
jgi:hypothetical protein